MLPRTAIVVLMSAAAAAHGEDLQAFVTEGPGIWMLIGGIVVLLAALALLSAIGKRAVAKFT